MTYTTVGIDVSKATGAVAFSRQNEIIEQFKIDLNRQGFDYLKQRMSPYKQVQVIFEATGVYSKRVEAYMRDNDIRYAVLSPVVGHKRISNYGDDEIFIKTDESDARALAASARESDFENFYHESETQRELRDMNRFYEQLEDESVKARTRTHRITEKVFSTFLDEFTVKGDSKFPWLILSAFPHPDLVLDADVNEVMQTINGLTNKNIGQKQLLNYAKKLYKAASLAYSEVSKESDTVMQVSYWAKRTAEIQDLQNAQINKMHSIVRDYPEYKHFLSLPGIGQNTAVRLIAELGDLRRFSSVRKLNAYVGIGHGKRSSGMITNPEKITHTGNAHARRLIFNVVANMRKAWRSGLGKPNHLMEYDKKRRSENSKLASKINTVATMDRVLRTLFNLVKLNQDYIYEFTQK